jgi:hypothetical protein
MRPGCFRNWPPSRAEFMRAAASQRKGLNHEPIGLIGSACSLDLPGDEHELIFESRRQPVPMLDRGTIGLIGKGGSRLFSERPGKGLPAIRPCRESSKGWTPGAARLPGNHSSLELNERGPALNVFWIPDATGIGREASATAACQPWGCRGKKPRTKKTEPEGVRARSHPGSLLSVRI